MTLEEQIQRANLLIHNALHYPSLQKKLAAFGYNKEKLLKGKGICEKVVLLNTQQQKEYGESYDATDTLKIAKEEAWQLYMRHLGTARFAFKDDRGAEKALVLGGKRKRSLFGWLDQARTFYANIGDMMEVMQKYNVTEAEIEQGQAMVEAVYEAHENSRKEHYEARQSTQRRDEALGEMKAWINRFIRVAELALEEDPEAMEQLGLMKKA